MLESGKLTCLNKIIFNSIICGGMKACLKNFRKHADQM